MKQRLSGPYHGIALVVATIVGGGMFALPLTLENIWFTNGVLILIISAVFMLATGLMLVDVNLRFPSGTSFHTLSRDLLGRGANLIVGLSFVFVLYLITYAYISGASSALSDVMARFPGGNSRTLAVIVITLFVSAVVCKGGKLFGYILSFFVAGKFTSFFLATAGMVSYIRPELLAENPPVAGWAPFILAIPVCVVSFGFHGSIPSLIKMYGRSNHKHIVRSLCFGVLLSCLIYIYWLCMTMGILDKLSFEKISHEGGNVSTVINIVMQGEYSQSIKGILLFFACFAVVASLMSASLGLCDYIRDLIKSVKGESGGFLPVMLTYVPPALFCIVSPDGFVVAISFAGIALVIWSVLLPPLLLIRARKLTAAAPWSFPVGNNALYLFFLLGVILWGVMLWTLIRV